MKNLFAIIIAAAFAIAVGDHVGYETYWHMSGAPITVSWDATENATFYKWQNYSPVRKKVMATGEVQTNQVDLAIFTGHNVFSVTACNDEGCAEDLSYSTDEAVAVVDGQAKGWWVFGVIGAPGPITQ